MVILLADIDELYDKKIKCPVCDTEITTKKVRASKLRLIKRDEDFMPYYQGESPLKYSIFICPNCGYAAPESKFSPISKNNKEIILKEISSKWHKRSYGGKRTVGESIETYKLAIYIGQLLEYKKVELGSLTLNLAWLYRIKEDKEEERFLRLTKSFYEEGYYKENLAASNMDEIKLGYLLGEINRRLGDKEQAIKWFNTVISNPNSNSNPALKKMIMEQWRFAKEG